ncbi:MAG: hypothetical protein HQL73_09650 [Magnetococcales bacterium]|nr:hypothetical protein [Magnetococcales bacterium]
MAAFKLNDADITAAVGQAFVVVEKQVRFAASLALTRTAGVVRDELNREMRSIFDRPNPYTLNSLRIVPSTKQTLEAKVWFKDPPSGLHYLEPQVYGGGRQVKRFEKNLHRVGQMPAGWFAIPTSAARTDAYGNISVGQLNQILSALRAFPEVGYLANRTRDPRRAKRNQPEFVVIGPGGSRPPGVYQRWPNGGFARVLAFVPSVSYRKRFDFFGIAQRVVAREMAGQFEKALLEAKASAW